MADRNETMAERLARIVGEIELGMACRVRVEEGSKGWFVQIECHRLDVITKEMGWGRGGKAHPSEFATDSEIIQMIFGLYLSYWTHEARENFQWRGRRVFGPHISTEALWEVATRVDVRSAQHVEDRDERECSRCGDEVQILNSQDECLSCEEARANGDVCSRCAEDVDWEPGLGAYREDGVTVCGSCAHNERRSS